MTLLRMAAREGVLSTHKSTGRSVWLMSSDANVSLSVIVPAHNVQGYIRECLESVLDSDCPHLEVIAVNDCSPDGCGQILDEFAQRDPRVRVQHLEQNVGLGEARNIGLEMATGE